MGNVPKNKLGSANGITQLVKNLGMVIGIAFSVALFTTFLGNGTENYGPRFMQSTQKGRSIYSRNHRNFAVAKFSKAATALSSSLPALEWLVNNK